MKKSIVIAVILGTALLSTVALAGTRTRFISPGLQCRYYGTQGSDTYFNPSGYGANGLQNDDGSTRYVACPVVNQSFDGYNEYWNWSKATINSQSAVCKRYTSSIDGSGTTWQATTSIVAVENGYYQHVMNAAAFIATYERSISLYCSIPSGAVIANYETEYYRYD